jgi:hypothetical protein
VSGHEFDEMQWERLLKPPFDPWCERIAWNGEEILVLRSSGFDKLGAANDVRQHALTMIGRLNGAFSATSGAKPLTFKGVGCFNELGQVHFTVFAELHDRVRVTDSFTAEVRDANGNLIPPPPPQPSAAQRWIKAAEDNDDIADLLVFAGRADNWFDIYKAVEMAERLVGGERNLPPVLGPLAKEFARMQRTANSMHRHAPRKFQPPAAPTSLDEARSILSFVVRTVLDRARD